MPDLKFEIPATEEIKVDSQTSAAIQEGIADADQGRTVSLDEARKLIPKWISNF